MSKITRPRLDALRGEMKKRGIDAFIVPGTDPHLSEYYASHWGCRTWVTGFNGSAGTAVVTTEHAGLWTDSRYFLQAAEQLEESGFELFKDGLPDTPGINEWLLSVLPQGATVAIDGSLFSYNNEQALKSFFESHGFHFVSDFTPFDAIWTDRPAIPTDRLFIHDEKYSGESLTEKADRILEKVHLAGANAILLAALDEIAWVFNIRGTDVAFNPVVVSFAFIDGDRRILFIDKQKIGEDSLAYLQKNRVEIRPYTEVYDFLKTLAPSYKVLADPKKINASLMHAIASPAVTCDSPIALLKSIKNATQIEGIRQAMVRDGVALVKFFRWLDRHIDDGNVTEMTVDRKLREFRSEQPLFVCESFGTIAGFNPHGAIVHYSATPDSDATLSRKGFLLVDSGAQYIDGTTDITRTVALGELTDRQKRDFTLVMKGHIAIATSIFPQGTRGAQLDALARHFLWKDRVNYLHGTGHGVGHFLNVHEGPQNIRLEENPTPLMPGMLTSNEPGLYRAGQYGIRCENLVLTVEDSRSDEFGQFYRFETLTLFPFDKKAFDTSIMTEEEIEWLDNYHRMVYEKLSPSLDAEERAWLADATSPLI